MLDTYGEELEIYFPGSEAGLLALKGFKTYVDGSILEAIELWHQALALDPGLTIVSGKLRYVDREVKDIRRECAKLREVLHDIRTQAQDYLQLARLLIALGEKAEAIRIWEQISTVEDKNASKYAKKMLSRHLPANSG